MGFRPAAFLRLIRLPNTLTAAADVVAGAALAGSFPLGWPVLGAALGSGLIYGGGVALNDVRDLEHDRRWHRQRVLPQGALRVRTATLLSVLLLLSGLASAAGGGLSHQVATAFLVVLVVAYDLCPRRLRIVGPLLMGGCRAANLLRGITLGPWPPGWPGWVAVGGHAWLVIMVTAVSTFEEDPRPAGTLRFLAALLPLPYLVPLLTAADPLSLSGLLTLLVAMGLTLAVVPAAFGVPPRPGVCVARAVFTLVLLDAAYVMAAGHLPESLLLAGLLPLMLIVARLLRQEGS